MKARVSCVAGLSRLMVGTFVITLG